MMIERHRGWTTTLLAAALAVVTTGCELESYSSVRYTCSIQVSPVGDPGLVLELDNLNDERLLDGNGNTLWDYFQCLDEENCPECGFVADQIVIPSGGEMDGHWERLVATRIAQLAADDPNSDFARFDLWCQVPGTRECRPAPDPAGGPGAELLFDFPACTDAVVGEVGLPLCQEAPPVDSCLAIDCGEGEGCTAIDFGPVAIGQQAERTVTLRNCGGEGDPVVTVSAIRQVPGIGSAPAAFGVAGTEQSCLPEPPAEEKLLTTEAEDPNNASCSFLVTFRPPEPQPQSADLRFRGAAPQHEIDLSGAGVSGTPVATPERLCIEEQPGEQCSGPATLAVTNSGPGDLLISELRIPELNGEPQNFQLVPPEGPPLPVVLPADGTALDLEIQWCESEPRDENARLEIVNSNPVTPTFEVPISLRPDCSAAPPPP
jgi:hypothetical protein